MLPVLPCASHRSGSLLLFTSLHIWITGERRKLFSCRTCWPPTFSCSSRHTWTRRVSLGTLTPASPAASQYCSNLHKRRGPFHLNHMADIDFIYSRNTCIFTQLQEAKVMQNCAFKDLEWRNSRMEEFQVPQVSRIWCLQQGRPWNGKSWRSSAEPVHSKTITNLNNRKSQKQVSH